MFENSSISLTLEEYTERNQNIITILIPTITDYFSRHPDINEKLVEDMLISQIKILSENLKKEALIEKQQK